jgi:hypothetical protein
MGPRVAIVPRAVLVDRELTPTDKLVFAVLASHANSDREAWPSQHTLAKDVGVTRETVYRAIGRLRVRGYVESSGALGESLTYSIAPAWRVEVESVRAQGGESVRAQGGESVRAQGGESARSHTTEVLEQEPPSKSPPIDGAALVAERDRAQRIIEIFNDIAGTKFSGARAHVQAVTRRLREHPSLSDDDHRAIIAASFESPWWKRAPDPRVVYGNAALFEQAIEQLRLSATRSDNRARRAELTRKMLDVVHS